MSSKARGGPVVESIGLDSLGNPINIGACYVEEGCANPIGNCRNSAWTLSTPGYWLSNFDIWAVGSEVTGI